jgi:hypothetical protein
MGRHGHLGRHRHHSRQVAKVATVTHVVTVAPRGSTAGSLLLFSDEVRTAKKTQHFTITKISLFPLFMEIITVYTENHTKHKNVQTFCISGFIFLCCRIAFVSAKLKKNILKIRF